MKKQSALASTPKTSPSSTISDVLRDPKIYPAFKTWEFERWAKPIDPTELGRCLKEYVAEANHGGWDGFASRDLTGVRRFLYDLHLYFTSGKESDPETFRTLSNINTL